MYNQVLLPVRVWRDIVKHMTSEEDAEVCGLLAGRFIDTPEGITVGATIESFTPITNINPDPAALFVMDPTEQLGWHNTNIRDGGLHNVGCVHSHPHGFGIPSEIDRGGIGWDHAWLIWGHLDNTLRAWWPDFQGDEPRFRAAHMQWDRQTFTSLDREALAPTSPVTSQPSETPIS